MAGNISRYVAKQFGNPTGLGGTLSTFIMNRINQKQYNAVMHLLSNTSKNDRILDIGYGNGYMIKRLAKKYDATLYGIEISSDMLNKASQLNQKFIKEGKVCLEEGNAEDICFVDAYFNQIYTINTVYFWENLEKGLQEIYRVLAPNGIFLNVIYTKEWLDQLKYTSYGFAKYSLEELSNSANRVGFQSEIIEIKKGVSYCILAKK